MLCAAARVDSQKFRAGFLNAEERRNLQMAAADLVECPLYIDDTAGTNLMDIHAKLRRLKAEQGLGLVIIDYLQLMSAKGRYENRVQEVSALSRGLKLLSKELSCPIIALSQLSRATETRQGDHRPQLSDLRESGSIEQDADVVNFIFREEVYKPDRTDLKGLAELIISKQRSGPTGKVQLVFLHHLKRSSKTGWETLTMRVANSLLAVLLALPAAFGAEAVDQIWSARYVVTMDGSRRVISNGAVAVKGDRIVAVGARAEIDRGIRRRRGWTGRSRFWRRG